MPVDVAVKKNGCRKEISVKNFPQEYEIFDIGEGTINRYMRMIKHAEIIFIKGPLGYYQEKQFRTGTKMIFGSIPRKSLSIIGGGDTTTAMSIIGIKKSKFTYVSLSGGALSEYIAGNKLPGIEALKKVF